MCGWAQGCATADVDALLFGAVTVYRTLSLSTGAPKATRMARVRQSAVRRVLGLRRGGTRALIAVAQLAGGDYDVAGAERVGDALAVGAVRQLLKGLGDGGGDGGDDGGDGDDAGVLDALQRALAAGPDAALDALTHCTGCKRCGHDGGRKGAVKAHGKGGCAACGTSQGCAEAPPGRAGRCWCRFHASADARLLNRVVRRAAATPGFLDACR